MGLSKLFASGERQQDIGHFRNMVFIARADNALTESEKTLLSRIGSSIGLTEEEIQDLMRNPGGYPVSAPTSRAERLEQMVNLIQMAQKDGKIQDAEHKVLNRVAVELGYKSIDDIDLESILALVVRGEDTDVIVDDLL